MSTIKPSRERERMRKYHASKKKAGNDKNQTAPDLSIPTSSSFPGLDVFDFRLTQLALFDTLNQEASNSSQISVERRLPVEIWRHIFALATLIAGKDEFSTQSASYNPMFCDKVDTITSPSPEEQSQIIKTRFNIVRVCKYWYFIGVQSLWSHLRLVIHRSSSRETSITLLESLQKAPVVASYVIRFTVVTITNRNPSWLSEDVRGILSRLPKLKIMDCPILDNRWPDPLDYDVIALQSYGSRAILAAETHKFYHNTRVMNIYLNNVGWDKVHSIELPRLESLNVRGIQHGRLLARHIANSWILPSLQILSISGAPTADWIDCLNGWGKTLQKVQVNIAINYHENSPATAYTPELTELHVSFNALNIFQGRLKAPKLHRLAVFNIGSTIGNCGARINGVINACPAIQQLCLVPTQGQATIPSEAIAPVDLASWQERGILVEFRSNLV
jgi:hypothetical protein